MPSSWRKRLAWAASILVRSSVATGPAMGNLLGRGAIRSRTRIIRGYGSTASVIASPARYNPAPMSHSLFTDEHELLRRSIRAFVEKEVTPHVVEWEDAGRIPRAFWRRLGELGFLGLEF